MNSTQNLGSTSKRYTYFYSNSQNFEAEHTDNFFLLIIMKHSMFEDLYNTLSKQYLIKIHILHISDTNPNV
jgi:hypothetical protein